MLAHSGYLDSAFDVHEAMETSHEESLLSRMWSKRRRVKHEDDQKVVMDLMEIRESVRGLLKVHGAPRDLEIRLAMLGQVGAGAAMFGGDLAFTHPIILLDKTVYENCEADEIMDVYCGIGLHEASHILHSRRIFEVGKEKSSSLMLWFNLLEDERIEAKVREESPGFTSYLQAVKLALFEKKEAGSIHKWKILPDKDKIRLMFFCFIRAPYLLQDDHKSWETLTGKPVYSALCKVLDRMPTTEDEVEEYAHKVQYLWEALTEEYDDLPESKELAEGTGSGESSSGGDSLDESMDAESSSKAEGTSPSEEGEKEGGEGSESSSGDGEEESSKSLKDRIKGIDIRKMLQRRADEVDELHEKIAKEAKKKLSERHRLPKTAKSVGDSLKHGTKKEETERKKLSKEIEDAEKILEEVAKDRMKRHRFGDIDIRRMIERTDTVTSPLSKTESEELVRVEDERLGFGEDWKHEGVARKTVITHPLPDKKVYQEAKKRVQSQVARMRQVFRFRLGKRVHVETERREGHLHRKMLSRATLSDKIFSRKRTRTDRGLSLCLLLDESGSMGSTSYSGYAQTALDIAVCIAEGLRYVPGVELEVYSYASCGTNDKDCLVKYLYGKQNPNVASIGGYCYGNQNYDHMAINTAVDLFMKNTSGDANRVMLVLSDGSPAGYKYGGSDAVRATKRAVESAERKGILVMQVAIRYFDSEKMFKHFVRYTDMASLISKMRGLIQRFVREVT